MAGLIDQEVQRLEGLPAGSLLPGYLPSEAGESARVRLLRLKQYRRLCLELSLARPEPVNPQEGEPC